MLCILRKYIFHLDMFTDFVTDLCKSFFLLALLLLLCWEVMRDIVTNYNLSLRIYVSLNHNCHAFCADLECFHIKLNYDIWLFICQQRAENPKLKGFRESSLLLDYSVWQLNSVIMIQLLVCKKMKAQKLKI